MDKLATSIAQIRASGFSFNSFQGVLLLLTGVAALILAAEIVQLLPVRTDNMYPEASNVLAAQRWSQGLPLYEDYRQEPYLVTAFPPLWYSFLALAARSGFSDLDSLTFVGRFLSVLSLIGAAVLAYRWNRRLGLTFATALAAPALYLSFPVLLSCAVTARPDFPALFLSLLAVYWASFRSGPSSTPLAATVAACAFLIRHNSVAAPVAIVLWLLLSKRWKHAAVFCAVWAIVVGGVLLPFHLSSDGLLLLNLSSAKFGNFAVTYAHDIVGRIFALPNYGFVIILFVLGLLGLVETGSAADRRTTLLPVYVIVSLGIALLGTASAGGGLQHYLEAGLALAVLAPSGLARLKESWHAESPFAAFAMLVVVVLLFPALDVQRRSWRQRAPQDLRYLTPIMQSERVLTDIPYLAARATHPELLDLVSLVNSQRRGGWAAWSSARVVEDLRAGKYKLLILGDSVEPPNDPSALYPRYPHLDSALQTAIRQNYQLCLEVKSGIDNLIYSQPGGFAVYRLRTSNSNLVEADHCASDLFAARAQGQ